MTDQPTTDTAREPEEWALVEIMGHQRCAGRIQEVQRFGATLLRVDIPLPEVEGEEPAFVTEFYGGNAIYRLRPCSEEVARAGARQIGDPRPVAPVSYRITAPEPPIEADDLGNDFDDGGPY